jgi:hypothetical protein
VKTLFQPEGGDVREEADEGQGNRKEVTGLTLMEKMQLWSQIGRSESVGEEISNFPDFDEDYEEYVISNFPEAWKFLTESHAYKWMIGKLKCCILLTEFDGTIMEHIGNEIVQGLTSANRGRGYHTRTCKAFFEISCDLPAFIKDEFPNETGLQLGSIITITGSNVDAQALTCAEYMRQVWPTGYEILNALQETMDKGTGTGKSHQCKFCLPTMIIGDVWKITAFGISADHIMANKFQASQQTKPSSLSRFTEV